MELLKSKTTKPVNSLLDRDSKAIKICPALLKAPGLVRVQEKTREQASARTGWARGPGNPPAAAAVSQRWVTPGATCRPRRLSPTRSRSRSRAPGFLENPPRAVCPQVPTPDPRGHTLTRLHARLLVPAWWHLDFSTEESQMTVGDRAPADASIPCVSSRLRFQLLWLFSCLLVFFHFFFFFFSWQGSNALIFL